MIDTSLIAENGRENASYLAPFLPRWLAESGLNAGQLSTYLHVCRLASQSGHCYASQSYIAKLLGSNRETIGRYLAHLEEKGFILVDRSSGRADHIYPTRPGCGRMAYVRDANDSAPLVREPDCLPDTPRYVTHNIYGDDISEPVGKSDTLPQNPTGGVGNQINTCDKINHPPVGKSDTKVSNLKGTNIRGGGEEATLSIFNDLVKSVEAEYPKRRDVRSISERMCAHYQAQKKWHMITVSNLKRWIETERNPRYKPDVPLHERRIPEWRQLWLQVFEVMPRESHTWQYLATVYPEDARKVWEAYEKKNTA